MSNSSNKDTTNLIEKLIFVNKVTKVVKGGKILSFAALVVVGDKKGRVGFGTGKAREVTDARTKAFENAKKSLIKVYMKEARTIHHDIEGRHGSAKVVLRSAVPGTGIISGGPMRSVFECLGLKDIVAKSLGSNNPYNMVEATFDALQKLSSPKVVSERRNRHISEVIKRRNIILNSFNNNEE